MGELQVTSTEIVNFTTLEDSDIEQAQFIFETINNYVRRYLKEGIDYGLIPGCGNKKVLYKAGGEKLLRLFRLRPKFELVDRITDYEKGLFHYHYRCSLYRYGELLGECDGIANSKEPKFNRKVLTCPKCGSNESVFKDRNSGNYYCWAKKGGCGARDLSPSLVDSRSSSFDYNTVNTLCKMAQKRALVGAVLIVCGASEYFSQDLEDYQ